MSLLFRSLIHASTAVGCLALITVLMVFILRVLVVVGGLTDVFS